MTTNHIVADPFHGSPKHIHSFVNEIESMYLLDTPRKIGTERRTVERLAVTMPVRITPLDDQLKPLSYELNAITRDLSSKGVGLVSTSPIAREYVLLTFQPFQGNSFDVVAKVIYCNDLGYYFQIGCEFQVS
jgi:hypothetical protein